MAKNSANAVSYRRSLFLTTAIVALTAMACMQPASAQSVTGAGLSPGAPTDPTLPWSVGGSLTVGGTGVGNLSILDGGTVNNTTGNIANGATGNGTVTVSGTGAGGPSTWTNSADLNVGLRGFGTLEITGGGVVSNTQGSIGRVGGNGKVTVSGTDASGNASTWTNGSGLLVGFNGTGELIINGGGQVTSAQGDVGYIQTAGSSAVGTVTISGGDSAGRASTWWNSSLFLGKGGATWAGGSGTVKIEDGGAMITSGYGYVGYEHGGDGTVTVSGHDANNASTWTLGTFLHVGEAGKGTLNILDGGTVSNTDGVIGAQNSSADSIVTVDGPGSSWTNTGELRVGDKGTGAQLTITGGGTVSNVADANIGFDVGSSGTVIVSGTDGTHASTWTNTSNLVVGSFGNGTLNILNGGQVTNQVGYIGAQFTGTGVNDHSDVIVSGHDASGNASTWTNNDQLNIGDNGAGNLTIQDGGVVNVGAGAVLGLDSNGSHIGVGTVTVTGRDINGHASTFNVTGNLTVGGDANDNKLDILNGGVVNSGAASIGDVTFSGSSKGTVTVSGRDANGNASTWNSGNIYVGDSGDGTLNIRDGGAVTASQPAASANLEIGFDVGSTGTVTVSSTTGNVSSLIVGGTMNVGAQGTGTLTLDGGSSVSVRDNVNIAQFGGSTGTVTVSSTTGNVASLAAGGTIYVGSQGTGTMTVDKGGFVSAGGDVNIGQWNSGTLHLNGDGTVAGSGVLETGSVIKGFGTTNVLDLDGGILRANRNETNFLNGFTALTVNAASFDTNGFDIGIGTEFSGSSTTSFNKLGLGQLTLLGDSSGFTGDATVSAGTLAVNGVLGGNMLVDTAGRLAGTGTVGNDVINHNVLNKGIVAPGYNGAMGTLTIQGNYVSTGGRLEIATALGDDSSQTSRLVVNGNTSGSTQVSVINQGGLGAQTVEGIKIVDVVSASNGTFVLNGNYVFQGTSAVIAGAYAYRLYKGGVSDPLDGDWYLRSDLLPPGGPGGPASTPLYQPGVPIYESYGANLQALNTLPTLQQRVGNRTWGAGATGDGNGIWGRSENTHGRFNPAVSTSGLDQSIDTWKMQAGADRVFVDNASGRLVAGINVSYGNANSRINSVFGNGDLKTDGYGLGATLTWYSVNDFYVDGQAQVSHYSSDLMSELRGSLGHDNGGRGEALSIEAGKRIALSDKLGITPQFQMVYSNVQFDRFFDPSAADVSADKTDSLKTRWGVAFDHQSSWDGRRSRIYGIANVSYEWLNGMRTLVSGTPFINADERLWGELGLGASVTWRKDLTVYGELSGNTPFRGFGNSYIVKGNIGLRAQF